MSTAFLFPGQGVDLAAAGRDWVERSRPVRELLDAAAAQVGRPLAELFGGGGRALARTEVGQPLLTALCLGIHRELRTAGLRPRFVAGHSLGEIAASAAAGVFDEHDAVALAALRGRLMSREAGRRPGGMLALVGVGGEAVEEALALGARQGEVHLAAWNAPNEAVVAGDPDALQRIAAKFPGLPLAVEGAWHGPRMAPAVEEFRRTLHELARPRLDVEFVCNRTGLPVDDPARIPDLLAEQLVHPVLWAATLETLAQAGIAHFVTIGPGRVLRGLLRKSLGPDSSILGTDSPEDLASTVEALG